MEKIEAKDMIWSRGVWSEIKHTPEDWEEHEKERGATIKEAALTFYENRKAATKDEVEIDLINLLESYWR